MTDERAQRVFAVSSADAETVHLLGFGLYVGDHPRPGTPEWKDRSEADRDLYRRAIRDGDADPFDPVPFYESLVAKGEMTRTEADEALAAGAERRATEAARPIDDRAADLAEHVARNPKIVLDNGDVVWGCECWWGPEERYEQMVAGRQVVERSMPELRAAAGVEEGRNLAVPAAQEARRD